MLGKYLKKYDVDLCRNAAPITAENFREKPPEESFAVKLALPHNLALEGF
jgi:hypothetical protein